MKKKIIHIEHNGRLANRMFQYMFARSLQTHIVGSVVSGCTIPEFGVDTGNHEIKGGKTVVISGGHDYNIGKISYLVNNDVFDIVVFSGYGMRVDYYQNTDLFRSLFHWGAYRRDFGYGDDHLVIHIRLEDIANGYHQDYMPIPISFYRKVIADSGLKPVFMGQLDQTDYCQALRDAFPNAMFVEASSVQEDFNRIRLSKNILLSLSSFAWLAAYFSDAATIHLPVYGIFNPLQRPDINLLPLWDPRYRFYWIEPRKWTASDADQRHLLDGDIPLRALSATDMGYIFSKTTI